MVLSPPERIDVAEAGVVLRRHAAGDADALHAVIASSRDHLRPFMPWADQDRDTTAQFVDKVAEGWASGADYNFLITVPESGGDGEQIIGGCGLHRRGDRATIEIGYWLRPDVVGRGLMTAVARALTATAFTLDGIAHVAIRCDAANERSTAIPKRIGFVHVEDEQYEPVTASQTGSHQVWVCDRPEGASAAAGTP